MQPLAFHHEFQLAFSYCGCGVACFRQPIAPIPWLHCAATILALRNSSFEVAVVERVIFDFDGEALIMRIDSMDLW